KFGWLNTLIASIRNSNCARSVILKRFTIFISRSKYRGPRSQFGPRVPTSPGLGLTATTLPLGSSNALLVYPVNKLLHAVVLVAPLAGAQFGETWAKLAVSRTVVNPLK